jgi:hypothetical protein
MMLSWEEMALLENGYLSDIGWLRDVVTRHRGDLKKCSHLLFVVPSDMGLGLGRYHYETNTAISEVVLYKGVKSIKSWTKWVSIHEDFHRFLPHCYEISCIMNPTSYFERKLKSLHFGPRCKRIANNLMKAHISGYNVILPENDPRLLVSDFIYHMASVPLDYIPRRVTLSTLTDKCGFEIKEITMVNTRKGSFAWDRIKDFISMEDRVENFILYPHTDVLTLERRFLEERKGIRMDIYATGYQIFIDRPKIFSL